MRAIPCFRYWQLEYIGWLPWVKVNPSKDDVVEVQFGRFAEATGSRRCFSDAPQADP